MEVLVEANREQQTRGLAQKCRFLMFVAFSNEFDAGLVQQWKDLFAKVSFVHPIDFRGDFERDTGRF
jgi:hypothetical protein